MGCEPLTQALAAPVTSQLIHSWGAVADSVKLESTLESNLIAEVVVAVDQGAVIRWASIWWLTPAQSLLPETARQAWS